MSETITMKKEGLGILTKLLFGFFLALFIHGIGDFYSFTQMNRLYDLTTKIFNHPLQVTRAVLSADTNIVKIHRSMKDVALSSTPIEIEIAVGFVNNYEKKVNEHLGITEKLTKGSEGAALYAEIAKLFRDWKPIRDKVIDLTKAGNGAQAFAITKGKGAEHVELLNSKIEEMKDYAATKASVMISDSRKTKETITRTASIIFFILVLLAGLLGFFLSRTITDPIKQLIKGVTEFGRGNLDFKIETNLKDEIGWLANAFNNMATQRKKVVEELKLQNEIIRNMAEGVFLVSAEDGSIVYVNPKLEKMFGYNQNEMIGKNVSIVNAPTEKSPEQTANEIIKELNETGEWHGEVNNIKKDGSCFWCNANVSKFEHFKYGRVLVSVHTDITKRKQLEKELLDYRNNLESTIKERTKDLESEIKERELAEEQIKASLKEKETLLQEIHHRVKNNMQVICSLLDLQSNSFEDKQIKEILKDSQSRVYTMSIVHETLHDSDKLSEIDLQTYLSKLTAAIFQAYSVESGQVSLISEVENILISINQASPLGLIINEIISNSLKYAFPDNRKGDITVSIKKIDNELVLILSDNGIGMPENLDWQNSNSLGLKLVRSLVEDQLGGSIEMEYKNGTTFNIKFGIKL